MNTYIRIAIENDARWRVVTDRELRDCYRIGDVEMSDSLAKKSNVVAYARGSHGSQGSNLFFCATKMDASYPRLFAKLSNDEVKDVFNGRISSQLIAPEWFTNLENSNHRKMDVVLNLPNFSTWIRHGDDVDAWFKPKFDMSVLAKIVDKLLTALKNGKKANIVLSFNEKNIEDAQGLLRCALRCIPTKLSNQCTFNTATSSTISPFDICCGNFKEDAIISAGGEFFDVEKALSNDAEAMETDLVNPYAYYISTLNGEIDPCDKYNGIGKVDDLNAAVKDIVLKAKGDKLLTKCESNSLTLKELKDFAVDVEGCPEIVAEQLSGIANYLCLNYIGFVKFYNKLSNKNKDFYLQYINSNKPCPINVEETDSLFKQNTEEEGNSKYIANLYKFWYGEQKGKVYKDDKSIYKFLFSDFDERFKDNNNLRKAFISYWNNLNDDKFAGYLRCIKTGGTESIIDYVIERKKGEKIVKFVEYCCQLKTNKVLPEKTVSSICNKYLLDLCKQKVESVDDLLSAKNTAENNDINLTDDVLQAIEYKVKNEIKRKSEKEPPKDFIEYCHQLNENNVLTDDYISQFCKEYLSNLCSNSETTACKFVEYCCQFKTKKLLSNKTVSDFCNKYLLNLCNNKGESVDNLLSAKKMAKDNDIKLSDDVLQAIRQQVKDEIQDKSEKESSKDFIEYCCQLKTNKLFTDDYISQFCKEYLSNLCSNSETTPGEFVEYCRQLKTNKVLSEKTLSSICDDYFSNLCEQTVVSVDDLLTAKENAESEGIKLSEDVQNAIKQQVKDEIQSKTATPVEFIEYCCKLKKNNVLPDEDINKSCNKYLLDLCNNKGESVDNLLSAKKMAKDNDIKLSDDVLQAIRQQVKDEIQDKSEKEPPKDFIEYCHQLNENNVFTDDYISQFCKEYLSNLCSNSETTPGEFVEYCRQLKTNKVLSEKTLSSICDDYFSNLCEQTVVSVDDLLTAKNTAEREGIVLSPEVQNAIQQQVDEKNKEQCQLEVVKFLSQPISIQIKATQKKDKKIAIKRINERAKECTNEQDRKNTLSKKEDDVVIYNSARHDERDYGVSGTKETINYYGKLKIFSVLVAFLFALAMVVLLSADMLLLNKLYIFGKGFLAEIVLTGLTFLAGFVRLLSLGINVCNQYKEGNCNKDEFESESAKILKWLFVLCVCITFVKVILAILLIFVL